MAITSLREALIRDEGVRLMPYRDSEGLLTIGVGRCLDRIGVSLAEAEFLLDNDIQRSTADVLGHLAWARNLDAIRLAALINLCFNVGIGGLLGFTRLLAAAERGDWAVAAAELLDSKYHRQVGTRADRLSEQLKTGKWH